MRVRSLLTLGTGAAIGAGAMYLLDPDAGPERRRDARRTAVRELAARSADLAARGVQAGVRQASTAVEAAVYGYHAERRTPPATDPLGAHR